MREKGRFKLRLKNGNQEKNERPETSSQGPFNDEIRGLCPNRLEAFKSAAKLLASAFRVCFPPFEPFLPHEAPSKIDLFGLVGLQLKANRENMAAHSRIAAFAVRELSRFNHPLFLACEEFSNPGPCLEILLRNDSSFLLQCPLNEQKVSAKTQSCPTTSPCTRSSP